MGPFEKLVKPLSLAGQPDQSGPELHLGKTFPMWVRLRLNMLVFGFIWVGTYNAGGAFGLNQYLT